MTGEWERKKPHWWLYRVAGQEQPYAAVLRQREDGPKGPLWDALPIAGVGMAPLAEGVSLDEAKAAVERNAARHSGHA